MKVDIILAGVGGQGILSIASIIGVAAVDKGLYLKQAETHGMSQRGGAVVSHLRIADYPIASDLIPKGQADVIISVEPMESLRYVDFLADNGKVITNLVPVVNIPEYPELEDIYRELEKLPGYTALDADKIAREKGNPKATNMVMLGAASPFLQIDKDLLEKAIEKIFSCKGSQIVNLNIQAFRAGHEYSGKSL
ncbi:MAG: indolepyruvate oxidoreductase subunit beta [Prolixibacteraceae bacterium]|nr:indolepyruvate oxidoreductase subunit beta [Prolixibacteraceae bacterium]MBN2774963.1 indolepyruvate oxidoreductase subunit beta [Prolixibacteraceae bacterium]